MSRNDVTISTDRRRRWKVWLVAGLTLLLGLPLVGWSWWSSTLAQRIAELAAQLDRAGQPWRYADLIKPFPKASLEPSGLRVIAKTIPTNFLKPQPGRENLWEQIANLEPGQRLNDTQLDALRAELAKVDEPLKTARELARVEPPAPIELDPVAELVDLMADDLATNSVRVVARLLFLDILDHAHQGRSAEAMDSLVALMNLTRMLDHAPSMVVQLVRIALVQIVLKATQHLLALCPLDQSQLDRLNALLEREGAYRLAEVAFKAERAMAFERLNLIESGQIPSNSPLNALSGLTFRPFLRQSQWIVMNGLTQIINLIQNTPPSSWIEDTQSLLDNIAVESGGIGPFQAASSMGLLMLAPCRSVVEADVRRIAQVRVAQTALRLQKPQTGRQTDP